MTKLRKVLNYKCGSWSNCGANKIDTDVFLKGGLGFGEYIQELCMEVVRNKGLPTGERTIHGILRYFSVCMFECV